jgi:hypothetical protein
LFYRNALYSLWVSETAGIIANLDRVFVELQIRLEKDKTMRKTHNDILPGDIELIGVQENTEKKNQDMEEFNDINRKLDEQDALTEARLLYSPSVKMGVEISVINPEDFPDEKKIDKFL